MLIVANSLGGPGELGEWLEQMFIQVGDTARGVPGLWEFHLRKLEQEGPECLYVSLTIWSDRSSFNNWRTGERFAMAHTRARENREKFSRIHRRKRYDFDVALVPNLEYLDGLVLTKLSEDFHDLISLPAHFSEVLAIVEKSVVGNSFQTSPDL